MPVTTLQEKLLGQLPLVYFSENQFVTAQQKMLANATDPQLQAGIEKHIQQTKQHAANLEQVFAQLGATPQEKECPICVGLIKSGESAMQEAGNAPLMDVSIAGACVLAEHYEIAAYRGLIAQAQALGLTDVKSLLEQNLQDEEQTARMLEGAAPTMMQKTL